ncbi:MAG: hypothetical protein H6Q90_6094 [Deltaproteobacteria bacterium]|nr:hypothetical protein [Deltaproteobacteria bacterium]
MTFILRLISLAGLTTGTASSAGDDVGEKLTTTSPQVAQVQLAETLGAADAIHSVSANRHHVTFAITRAGRSQQVIATTGKRGQVVALTVDDAPSAAVELGGLSWLSDELVEATAITQLSVDEDGAITIATSEGRRYMAIPGRGSGGSGPEMARHNAGVEAQWAAEWNTSDR